MRAVLVAALASAALAAPRLAEACSYASGPRTVTPEDGAQGVPTNARVIVNYTRWRGDEEELGVRIQGGLAIAVATTRSAARFDEAVVLTPKLPLAPHTTYEVFHRVVDVDCQRAEPDCLGEPAVLVTFRTSAWPDIMRPILVSASVETRYAEGGPRNSCGTGSAVAHEITVSGVDDDNDSRWLRYNYYDARGVRVAGPLPLLSVGHGCGSGNYPSYDVRIPDDTFTLRAVDLAGNEDWNEHTLRGRPCGDFEGLGCSAGPGAAGLLIGLLALGLPRAGRAARSRRRR